MVISNSFETPAAQPSAKRNSARVFLCLGPFRGPLVKSAGCRRWMVLLGFLFEHTRVPTNCCRKALPERVRVERHLFGEVLQGKHHRWRQPIAPCWGTCRLYDPSMYPVPDRFLVDAHLCGYLRRT